jgi:cysteine desulfurase
MSGIATKSVKGAAVYLDHAATTPVCAAARAAMAEALTLTGNPSSVHSGGRAANAVLEGARDALATWAGADPESIVFASGGTEALALALNGSGATRVLASATEHSAVLAARDDIEILPVDTNGLLDLGALTAALAKGPALVAVQHANNETGIVQPLAAIAELVAVHGSRLLVDAVQSAGKLPLPHADFIALSAHKLGGPPGVGALIARDPASISAVHKGGGQERGRRGGTPNLPGIAGFAAALGERPDWTAVEARRNALEARLNTQAHGQAAPRLPNISSLALPGVSAQTQVMALDLAGFMVSAGAACSSGKVKTSHVLTAMGLGAAAGEAIRVSLSPATTDAELDAFADAWLAMARRLAPKAAA